MLSLLIQVIDTDDRTGNRSTVLETQLSLGALGDAQNIEVIRRYKSTDTIVVEADDTITAIIVVAKADQSPDHAVPTFDVLAYSSNGEIAVAANCSSYMSTGMDGLTSEISIDNITVDGDSEVAVLIVKSVP